MIIPWIRQPKTVNVPDGCVLCTDELCRGTSNASNVTDSNERFVNRANSIQLEDQQGRLEQEIRELLMKEGQLLSVLPVQLGYCCEVDLEQAILKRLGIDLLSCLRPQKRGQ